MSKMSRDKGANFEREIARKIYDELGIKVDRNLSQYQKTGLSDLYGLDGWSIECKRRKKMTDADITTFWGETCMQAKKEKAKPVLIYKEDYKRTRCVMRLCDLGDNYENFYAPVSMLFITWCEVVRETMK